MQTKKEQDNALQSKQAALAINTESATDENQLPTVTANEYKVSMSDYITYVMALPKELIRVAREKGLELETDPKIGSIEKKPYILLLRMLTGKRGMPLYKGYDGKEALAIAERATAITKEQTNEMRQRLIPGYSLVPELDDNYVLVNKLGNTLHKKCIGTVTHCLDVMEKADKANDETVINTDTAAALNMLVAEEIN